MVPVTMPQMGVSVAEGTVVEWKKQVGDWVQADEVIASISTDKIDTDVEAPASGRVAEIIVGVGETVDVGTVMARIATDARPGEAHVSENGDSSRGEGETGTGEAAAALEAPGEAGELSGDTAAEHGATAQRAPRRDGTRRYSPVVMRIAAEHGVDLEQVEGTGRGGRVRKQDVLAFIESGGGAEEPPMHIESPYRPDEPAAARKPRPRLQRVEEVPRRSPRPLLPRPPRRSRPLASRCRGCVRRSARGWCSRCRPRRRARRSPRPT
jgi:2-oxoglutarate dehydrogenase E2 component (dihydrolipoamide succinyltransferase)